MAPRSEQETNRRAPSLEAFRFGFDPATPPAFKFDPTDADIVAHYLLPRALNLPNPHAHAIFEGDPTSAPPWEILERCGNVDHAFFFGPPTVAARNAGRKVRQLLGGVWQGQKATEDTVTLLRPGGGEVDIRYKRYNLSFCREKRGPCTGWVMHEYEILSPPLPGVVLTRIKAPKTTRKGGDGQQQQVVPNVPDPEQPGPSHRYDAAAMNAGAQSDAFYGGGMVQAAGDGFAGAQSSEAFYGGGMVENAGYCTYNNAPLQYGTPPVRYDSSYCASIQNHLPGTSYNYDAAAAMNAERYTGAQSDAFYGGGMVQADGGYYDPSGYVPEFGAGYGNYNGEYQEQWQYPQDQSNQYQGGDAAVMSAGGEQEAGDAAPMSSGGEQEAAGAPRGNSDHGSSGHSTISLCGDGEEECDDSTTFYNALFSDGDGDGFESEQNDAAVIRLMDN